MISKVQHIKLFGVFADFQWPAALPDFKKFNLVYGWNYSGKTTLSRVFRCFEKKQHHVDFASAQAQLRFQDGSTHTLAAPHSAPEFRVFNSDFIRENIGFDVGDANPILVLGAEDIAKQEALKNKRAERERIAKDRDANVRTREDAKTVIDRALTKDARDLIKNALSVPNYDKTRFLPKVEACKSDPESYLLDEEALGRWLAIYQSKDKKSALTKIRGGISSLTEHLEKAAPLLARVVTGNTPIMRLKENPTVEKWVREGRPLHNSEATCQFCGQPLPPDCLTRLALHFSQDYDNFMNELAGLKKSMKSAREETVILCPPSSLYPELLENFEAQARRLAELLANRDSSLEVLENAVAAKQTQAFTSLECPTIEDPAGEITNVMDAINRIIDTHNARTVEFDNLRAAAFTKIENHYAASFVRDQKYVEHLQHIAALDGEINAQGLDMRSLDDEIRTLESELSEASKGAERINELLLAYFGKDDLRIKAITVADGQRFQIYRAEIVAKNLSEGEKTAIAFAYFITLVQDGRVPVENIRIIIDDPISSLDANHLFNTYALIKTQLSGCRQLFILTHSFEFYNLIREWAADDEGDRMKKPQSAWKQWAIYYVKRIDEGKSTLAEIPGELLKFKSEYHYLFAQLYRFNEFGAADFGSLLNLPNITRRFMEAFGGIMIPRSAGLKGKMVRIFSDAVERERVWKFINHYSHHSTISRSLTLTDVSECKAVVRACLNAVQGWNTDYFADLKAEVV